MQCVVLDAALPTVLAKRLTAQLMVDGVVRLPQHQTRVAQDLVRGGWGVLVFFQSREVFGINIAYGTCT